MAETKTREIRIVLPEELFALLVPGEAKEHLLAARKELLLAVRSLIDARIASMEKRAGGKTGARKKIKVE